MIDYFKTLQNRVAARNALNAEANRLAQLLIANFTHLLGQKVMKIGGLMEKYKTLVPEPSSRKFWMVRHMSEYSLSFTIRTDYPIAGADGCAYEEDTIYVADLQDGHTIKRMYPYEARRTDYNAEEIRQAREAVKAAEEALDAAKSKCNPFGLMDR